MKISTLAFVIGVSPLLTCCAGPQYRPQPGPTATLENTSYRENFLKFGFFMVNKIDDQFAGFSPFLISPGLRQLTVTAKFVNGAFSGGEQEATTKLIAKIQPNVSYKLNGKISGEGNLFKANYVVEMWVEEKNSGKIVSEKVSSKTSATDVYVYVPTYFGK